MIFYLGTCEVHWLELTEHPLFISAVRLRMRDEMPLASCGWALDSGAFSELSLFGRWRTKPEVYAKEVRRWSAQIGGMAWASIQDWMCEDFILAKTGMTVKRHQMLTVENYLRLLELAPDLPWLPVLQGFERYEYEDHLEMYRASGIDLGKLPVVGVGSVCRRQHTKEAEDVIRALADRGLKLHLFGFKLRGLKNVHHLARSSDSMAWSFVARRKSGPLPGCTHTKCSNCLRFALKWRQQVLKVIGQDKKVGTTP